MHGVVRPIDKLGRIVIPKEYRKILNITNKDKLEIIINDDSLEIRKYDVNNKFFQVYNMYYKTFNSIYKNSVIFSDFKKIYYNDKIINFDKINIKFDNISKISYLYDEFVIDSTIFDSYYVIPIKDVNYVVGIIIINMKINDNNVDFINKLVNN